MGLLTALVATGLVLGPPQADTLYVELTVQHANESTEAQLASYFRRELRALGDVVVVDNPFSGTCLPVFREETRASSQCDAFTVSVLAVPLNRGSQRIYAGEALTVGVRRDCSRSFSTALLQSHVPRVNLTEEIVDTAAVVQALRARNQLEHLKENCGKDLFRVLYVWPQDADYLSEIRDVVAEIDNDVLEPER